MTKKPRKVFPTQASITKELRTAIRAERDWHLKMADLHRDQADTATRLLARTEPAKHKRFQPGDELTEIG